MVNLVVIDLVTESFHNRCKKSSVTLYTYFSLD